MNLIVKVKHGFQVDIYLCLLEVLFFERSQILKWDVPTVKWLEQQVLGSNPSCLDHVLHVIPLLSHTVFCLCIPVSIKYRQRNIVDKHYYKCAKQDLL